MGDKMNLTTSSVRCSLQVALLGAVTPNLRAVIVEFSSKLMTVFFYYQSQPSEDEIENSEIVVAEVSSDFVDVSVNAQRIILPLPNKIPETGIRIFHQSEP